MMGNTLKKSIRLVVAAMLLPSAAVSSNAQEAAVKTNVIYDAMTTPNLGVEISAGMNDTFQLFYGLNPWKFNSDTHGSRFAKHWVLMPEYRWWLCTNFNGHFIGAHAMGGEFNAASVSLPVPGFFFSGENIPKAVKDTRFQGCFAGLGVTYGYQWILDRHWNVEAEIGIGYNHIWYDQYPCYECGSKIKSGHTNYTGVTKLGLSLLYIF